MWYLQVVKFIIIFNLLIRIRTFVVAVTLCDNRKSTTYFLDGHMQVFKIMDALDLGCGVGSGSDSGDVFYVSI